MIRRPPRSTRTDTLFPYTTLFRSVRTMTHDNRESWLNAVALDMAPLFEALDAPLPDRVRVAIGFTSRSEEHTSELQSLMRISYAVFCLKKKKNQKYQDNQTDTTTTQHQPTSNINTTNKKVHV